MCQQPRNKQTICGISYSSSSVGERGSEGGGGGTSSLTMEVEAVTHARQWLASQSDAIILTHSMNLLQKVESGTGCRDWHTAMHSLRLQRLLWIYCPGHAGVSGNERTDKLASTTDIASGLQLGRAEVLRTLRNFLDMDRPKLHSIGRL